MEDVQTGNSRTGRRAEEHVEKHKLLSVSGSGVWQVGTVYINIQRTPLCRSRILVGPNPGRNAGLGK